MKTKYGAEVDNKALIEYFEILIGKSFKILPMFEKEVESLPKYLDYLMIEVAGGNELLLNNGVFLELLANLESLSMIKDHKTLRAQVFKSTNLCSKIIENLKGE